MYSLYLPNKHTIHADMSHQCRCKVTSALHLLWHDDALASCAYGYIIFLNSKSQIHADVSQHALNSKRERERERERNKKEVSTSIQVIESDTMQFEPVSDPIIINSRDEISIHFFSILRLETIVASTSIQSYLSLALTLMQRIFGCCNTIISINRY